MKPHALLQRMPTYHDRRAIVLQLLRQNLRREDLSGKAHQSQNRSDLFAMWLPRSQHARTAIPILAPAAHLFRIYSPRHFAATAHGLGLPWLPASPPDKSAPHISSIACWSRRWLGLVAIHATSRIYTTAIPNHMEPTKKKRPIRTLTLGPGAWHAKTAFSGPFSGLGAGKGPGSLPLSLPGPLPAPREYSFGRLGPPLSIVQAANLIGCSPWTVRQTLIPRGLPHFRSTASGKLIFYQDQITRWIEHQQQGGKTTK